MFDENLNRFPCREKTIRWALFYNIIDPAANNAYILLREAGENSYQKTFLKNLNLD